MYYWEIWWGIAALIWIFTILHSFVISKLRYKRKRILTPNKLCIAGTFLSAAVLFCPIYVEEFAGYEPLAKWAKSILISIQHSIRLFAFDGDYMDFVENVENIDFGFATFYTVAGAVLYAVAPLLTFGILLSFFKNFTAYTKYWSPFRTKTHIFSELNKRSLAFAKSIDELENKIEGKHGSRYRFFRRAMIVFTDVIEKDDECTVELLEAAREMGAILFTKDLESIKYRLKWTGRKLRFYLISEDEEEKFRHANSIMQDYDFKEVKLCVFSDNVRSELLLASKNVSSMQVTRINPHQTLIYHNLDVHGVQLFRNARKTKEADKVISAIIVGFGRYGFEMAKALCWFCQIQGYKFKLNIFDSDKNAEKRFRADCPGLFKDNPGEEKLDITVHCKTDIKTNDFIKKVKSITDATYIFVSLGTDEINLSTSVKLRSVCAATEYEGDGHKPVIETVIYDQNITALMSQKWEDGHICSETGLQNFYKNYYDIHMIGDLNSFYAIDTLINSDLVNAGCEVNKRWASENNNAKKNNAQQGTNSYSMPLKPDLIKAAYKIHKLWAKEVGKTPEEILEAEKEFYKYEYNYNSSIAKAMHERLRAKLNNELNEDIPGVGIPRHEIINSPELRLKVGKVEHLRWNQYMRANGYDVGDKKDHLAKTHPNLISTESLEKKAPEDLRKDA